MPSSLGPAEIVVILVVALIVLGPKRLPEAGRQVGKALSEVRRWTQDVKYEMSRAFDAEPSSTPTTPEPSVATPEPSTVTAPDQPEPSAAAAEPSARPEPPADARS
jgi:sec-independent protein translocase protein TatA